VTYTGVTGAAGSATLNTGDILTGIGGTNTFSITGNGGTAAVVETNNLQNVDVRAVVDTEINQVLMSGVTNASSTGSLGNVSFTNAQLGTTYSLNNTNNIVGDTADLTVTYQAASGTADTAVLSINNAGGKVGSTTITQTITTTASTGDIEAISLATAGSNQVSLGGGAKVSKFTITGDGTNTVTIVAAATNMTLDASGTSGTNTLVVDSLLSTADTIVGGSGADTLRGTISTATQMLPSISDVETLDLTFAAAGIFNATNVSDVTKITLTPTANSTFTNLSADIATIQIGKTSAISGGSVSATYASGSDSAMAVTLGATPTSGTAAVGIGRLTLAGNAGAATVGSAGSTTNTITVVESGAGSDDSGSAIVANKTVDLTLVGTSQALTISNEDDAAATVSATAATSITVDATVKDVTLANAAVGALNDTIAADESLATLDITAGAGIASVEDIDVTASSTTAAINLTANITAGTKHATVGTIDINGGGASGSSTKATVNLTSTAGSAAASGYVTVAGVDLDEGTTGTSSTAINMTADAGNVTLTTLTLTDTDSTALVVSAASGQTAQIDTLAGTSNLTTITASGAGTISLFSAGTSSAVIGDTVVNASATTGNFTLDLAGTLATNNVSVTLGNAGSAKVNTVLTGAGADVITGGSGNDTVDAGAGADVVVGGSGNDGITGGADADNLTGGAGADVFVQTTTSSVDSTANTLGATYGGSTLTFGDGVDIITDFVSGTDDLSTTIAGAVTELVNATVVGNLTINTNYFAKGTFANGVFTFDSTVTASTANVAVLVVADAAGGQSIAAEDSVVILTGIASVAAADFIA